jgi:transcriptional regulator with XRE-family HTH domain
MKIKQHREAMGLTREQLAEEVGISVRAVEYYEMEKREPKSSILKRIAKVLKCRMEDLI